MAGLIENALRHGGAVTTVRFSAEETGDGGLAIACEDDGAGVAADAKERIFERGYGANTGLGLSLAREALGLTGIAITETGIPGNGARFELAVPPGGWRRDAGAELNGLNQRDAPIRTGSAPARAPAGSRPWSRTRPSRVLRGRWQAGHRPRL